MRGKGMPECVTAHRLAHLRLSARDPHRFLHGQLLEMMTAPYPAARIDAEVCRGKYVLPRPLARRIRVFARQGIRQPHRTISGGQVALMQGADAAEVLFERSHQRGWNHRAAILPALTVTHGDRARDEVDVLDADAKPFEQPHPRSIEKGNH